MPAPYSIHDGRVCTVDRFANTITTITTNNYTTTTTITTTTNYITTTNCY